MGAKPEDKPIVDNCNICNTIFEYTKKDINHDQHEGNYVICPCCGKFINAKS